MMDIYSEMEHPGIFLVCIVMILISIVACCGYKLIIYGVDKEEYISDSQMYTILFNERKKECNDDYSLI